MIIGVPKEIKLQEHRIGLTPESVKVLTDKKHEVLIQVNGGFEAGFTNEDYLKVGAKITEREFERALLFCGTGTGIHIAASKCPHVHTTVVQSVAAAKRAITGNNVNVLAMGAFYVAPQMGIECSRAFLENNLGSGWEYWNNFYEFHKLAYDELEAFDYEEFKNNNFEVERLGDFPLELEL